MEKNKLIGNSTLSIADVNNQNIQILVVDDDNRLRTLLMKYFGDQGFRVQAAADGFQMDKIMVRDSIDLLILDLMMPGEDGLSICRRLRATGNTTPLIMLTARGEDVDRILGLEMGADDYLAKPFNPRELLARVNAILRRQTPNIPGAPVTGNSGGHDGNDKSKTEIELGEVVVNLNTRSVHYKNDEVVQLTTGEFSLLKILLQNPNQPLSRDKLMSLARGRGHGPFDRAIDVQISRLRKLIEKDPTQPRYLQTVWGFGYVFIPEENQKKTHSKK